MGRTTTTLRSWVGRTFFREVTLTARRAITPRFHRLTLEGSSLVGVEVAPGDKVQVMMPDAGPRTYSPFATDARRGAMDLLVHVHGAAPGARWGATAETGDLAYVFGPRGSLKLSGLEGPIVLFGDETSFGVARSLEERGAASPLACVFEVGDVEESSAVLDAIELPRRELVARSGDDAHLRTVEQKLRIAIEAHGRAHLVLTGSARSIQALRGALRRSPPPITSQKVKAYWALGKRGLD